MTDDARLSAILSGQIAALSTLVGLLIDKGVLTPNEVIEYFDQAADTGLTSDGGASAAQPSQAIVDFVRRRTRAGGRAPS
jgi:hypothetical protein